MPRSDNSTQPGFRAPVIAIAGILLALLLASCGSLPGSPPASVDRAERLLLQGNPADAAEMFERLADSNPPPEGTSFALRAVRAWIAANRAADAQRVYTALTAPTAEPLATDYRLLGIDLLLARGDSAEAWRRAAALTPPAARAEQLRVYSLQRRVALAAGRPVEGVQAGIAAERAAGTDTERATARRDLLLQLRQAAERGVRLDPAAARDALGRGWLELGQIAATAARSPTTAAGDVDRWRSRFPGHPGSTIAFADILGSGPATSGPLVTAGGTQIALLLPLTGRAAAQAGAVRDGLSAALNQLPEAQRPTLRVYDTGTQSVDAAIAAAQAEGAGFLVGPLTRDEVTAAAQAPRGLPLLLLNYLPFEQPGGPQVYQFALSPEDEARQVARRALAYGQQRAIVIAPTGDWGTRVVAAFRDELTRGGGSVIVQSSYDPARSEFTSAITGALKIDESRARHKRLEEVTGMRLGFEPRRRADVQMIFAAGYEPLALRQIRPQLRFFYAGGVPTYMTSESFEPDAGANRDIDGVTFPDTPWNLQSTGPVAEIRDQTQSALGDRGPRLARLFAFGYDAGQLVLALRNPQTRWPIQGVTGRLSPGADRRIARDLDWAEIRGGQPQPVAPRP